MERRRAIVWGAAALVAVVLIWRLRLQGALVLGVVGGSVYGFVALGLVLVYKSSGVFNFAQGEFGTVAVYALYVAHTAGLPYPVALLVGLAAAIGMGLLTERLVVRPLFDAPRVTLLVATAGVSLLAIGVQVWFGEAQLRRIEPAFSTLDRLRVLGVNVSDQRLMILVVLLVLAVSLGLFFSRTNLGLAIMGASQEPAATELVGISVKRLSSFVWAMAAALGGLAGMLVAPVGTTFGPAFLTRSALIPGFTAAVLGGMTSLPGAFVGGIIVGVAQNLPLSIEAFRGIPGSDQVVVFALLVGTLALRPQGLFAKA